MVENIFYNGDILPMEDNLKFLLSPLLLLIKFVMITYND